MRASITRPRRGQKSRRDDHRQPVLVPVVARQALLPLAKLRTPRKQAHCGFAQETSPSRALPCGSTVQILNPASYILQKLLIHRHRQGKASKDVLYIHDTLQTFAEAEEQLKWEWCQLNQEMPHNWLVRCRQRATGLGSSVHPHVIEATRIAKDAGRDITAEHIAGALRLGLAFLDEE